MKLGVTLDILNQKDTPAFYADTLANRPAAGFTGRVFISTDTLDLYRDTGTTWVLLSPSSTGTITGSGAAGQVAYFSAASNITGTNNLFYDTGNSRLGVNTNTPTAPLDVHSSLSGALMQLNQTSGTLDSQLAFQSANVGKWRIGSYYNTGLYSFGIFDVANSLERFSVLNTGQTFVGSQTTSSGLFVVNSSTADNQIVAIGANSPSIRVRNAGTAPTQQFGLGLSTATNNFIQGSVSGDFCVFNGSTTASPIIFGVYDGGAGNVQPAVEISPARNLLVGTLTDAGYKADINGTARIQGQLIAGTGATIQDKIIDLPIGSSGTSTGQIGFTRTSGVNDSWLFGIFTGSEFGIRKTIDSANTFTIQNGGNTSNLTKNILFGSGNGIVSVNTSFYNSLTNNRTYPIIARNNSTGASGAVGYSFGAINNSGTEYTFATIEGYKLSNWVGAAPQGKLTFNVTNGSTTLNEAMSIFNTSNVAINTATDAGFKLDVNGTARVQGAFTQTGSSNSATFGNGLVFDNGVSPTRIFGGSGTINYQVNVLSGIQHRFTNQGSGITSIGNLLQIDSGANLSDAASNLFIIYNQTTNPALFSVKGNGNVLIGTATSGASKLRIVGLPTSAVGLSSGDVYSNAGILTIVP